MSTPSKSAGKKRALSDDEASYEAPSSGQLPQTPFRPSKKRNAGQAPPTPATSAEPSTVRQHRGSSSRPEPAVFRLGTPLSIPTPSRGRERALSTSLSAVYEDDAPEEMSGKSFHEHMLLPVFLAVEGAANRPDPESDVDSQETVSMIDDVYDLANSTEQSSEMPANSTAPNVSGFAAINQNNVVTTSGQPAPATQMQFRCAYPQGCNQAQELITESRKCISHHFGRNKRQSRIIMFPRWCRMHYQQTSYKPAKGENTKRGWGKYKVSLVRNVVDIIEGQQPGVHFQLKLKKSENDRLNAFRRNKKVPDKKENTYQSPISVLEEFDKDFEGEHRPRAKVLQLLDWALKKLNDGDVDDVPYFEILPEWSEESYKKYAHIPELNKTLKAQADKIKPPKKQPKKQPKKLTKTIPTPTAIPTKIGGKASIIDKALSEDGNEPEFEPSEQETSNELMQSPTPMDVDYEDGTSDVSAQDADDEAENPDLPVPPRVKRLLAAQRVNKKGGIQKLAEK